MSALPMRVVMIEVFADVKVNELEAAIVEAGYKVVK
jgi:hypothetical protein